jgi:DNA modification methylase
MPQQSRNWQVTCADCLKTLPKLATATIDAVITDPPYGIGITGNAWDQPSKLNPKQAAGKRRPRGANPMEEFQVFSREWATACHRVLKPGGHLAAFAAPRTAHRLTCGLEEAGLEIRDTLMWLRGQGFPAARALPGGVASRLKPAWEPIILARKPLKKTLNATLARHHTGAMNIDACRIGLAPQEHSTEGRFHGRRITANPHGRWPANLLLSHSQQCSRTHCAPGCPIALLGEHHRFFYCSKAPRRERDAGCEALPRTVAQTFRIGAYDEQRAKENPVGNHHPTVKPLDLMRWLVRLITPHHGLILDPFTGSGSTGAAAILEGARFHGIERETTYARIARARIRYWATKNTTNHHTTRRRGDCDRVQPQAKTRRP